MSKHGVPLALLFGARIRSPMRYTIFPAIAIAVLSACASPVFDVGRTEAVLPLSRAWVDGRVVEYITTDISDLPMAQMMGANHVPGLASAINMPQGSSIVERVYKFPGEEQISVFQSAPNPVGAEDKDRSYSPLWRVVLVRWAGHASPRELKSEEELLAAEEKKEVFLELTRIVVNCPVIRGAKGQSLRGVR
jgi:hypothetical protein